MNHWRPLSAGAKPAALLVGTSCLTSERHAELSIDITGSSLLITDDILYHGAKYGASMYVNYARKSNGTYRITDLRTVAQFLLGCMNGYHVLVKGARNL